jgi:ketosteroid isomerase-like protein
MKNLWLFFIWASIGAAQTTANPAFLKEINEQIWQPFSEAYANNDGPKYVGLHSKSFMRATGGKWKSIANWQDFQEKTLIDFQNRKPSEKTTIGFRFIERINDGKTASERGIYRVIRQNEKGETTGKFYGKFHVFMRKEGDKWKIVIDYDSDEGGTINEASYNAAFAVDDFGKY